MCKLKSLYIFITLIFVTLLNAQNATEVQKLRNDLKSSKEDTLKVKILLRLSNTLNNSQFTNAITYANEALELSTNLNYIKGKSNAYNHLADAYWFHSDYNKALQYYFKAYKINDSIKDQRAIAFSLYNIGWVLCMQQHSYKDDNYLYQSLKIYQSLKDTSGLLKVYNAIASYYTDRSRNKEELDQKRYFDSAIVYFNIGINCAQKAKRYNDLGRIYGNLGDLFFSTKDYKTAMFYNEKSIDIHRKNHDSSSLSITVLNIGLCEMRTGKINEAILKFNLALDYTIRHDILDLQVQALQALSESYYKLGKFKEAYDYHQKFVELKLKIEKEAYSTNIIDLQNSYSLEKSEANVEQLKSVNEIQELKNKKNTYFIFGLLAVAFVVIGVAALLFKQNKQKHLINLQLKEQHQIIAEKKQEIDHSIQYAKGIQQAILPDIVALTNHFKESFVFYKPKDVVSGDFYWFGKAQDGFYCIAADCTGHGVPGALMSIIGIDKIEQAVFEKRISDSGKILSFLNQQIKKVLKQHSDASKQMDGMDIALLKFNDSLTEVQYAGANRPLFLIRDKTITEYKANKTAIAGFTPDEQEFTTTPIALQKEDALFIFTDGYADQFGGDEGKKFMSKNLKNLLLSVSHLSCSEQKQKIETAFMDWKRSYEQVDDVLIIGIKI